MVRQVMGWHLGVAVGFLALIGIGASVSYFLREPANLGFLEFPTIAALHVVLGAVYMVFAPFQFVRHKRSRHLDYHRRMGRILVTVGLVVGATALFIGLVIPFSGWAERVPIGLFGGLFLFALGKGFVHVRLGRLALHTPGLDTVAEAAMRAAGTESVPKGSASPAPAIAPSFKNFLRVISISHPPGFLFCRDATFRQALRATMIATWSVGWRSP